MQPVLGISEFLDFFARDTYRLHDLELIFVACRFRNNFAFLRFIRSTVFDVCRRCRRFLRLLGLEMLEIFAK